MQRQFMRGIRGITIKITIAMETLFITCQLLNIDNNIHEIIITIIIIIIMN